MSSLEVLQPAALAGGRSVAVIDKEPIGSAKMA